MATQVLADLDIKHKFWRNSMRIRPDVKHIKISDFPRTPWAVSFGVRQALMKAFNFCRQYPDKMMSFKAILTFMLQRVAEWEQSAQKVEFEGGSQRRPLVSGTHVQPALTVDPRTQDLQKYDQPSTKHSDAIEMERQHPTNSEHTMVNGAAVAEVPKRPAMPHNNPLKSQRAPEKQTELQQPVQVTEQPVTQVQQAVQQAIQPQVQLPQFQEQVPAGAQTLAERLAQMHPQQ